MDSAFPRTCILYIICTYKLDICIYIYMYMYVYICICTYVCAAVWGFFVFVPQRNLAWKKYTDTCTEKMRTLYLNRSAENYNMQCIYIYTFHGEDENSPGGFLCSAERVNYSSNDFTASSINIYNILLLLLDELVSGCECVWNSEVLHVYTS